MTPHDIAEHVRAEWPGSSPEADDTTVTLGRTRLALDSDRMQYCTHDVRREPIVWHSYRRRTAKELAASLVRAHLTNPRMSISERYTLIRPGDKITTDLTGGLWATSSYDGVVIFSTGYVATWDSDSTGYWQVLYSGSPRICRSLSETLYTIGTLSVAAERRQEGQR